MWVALVALALAVTAGGVWVLAQPDDGGEPAAGESSSADADDDGRGASTLPSEANGREATATVASEDDGLVRIAFSVVDETEVNPIPTRFSIGFPWPTDDAEQFRLFEGDGSIEVPASVLRTATNTENELMVAFYGESERVAGGRVFIADDEALELELAIDDFMISSSSLWLEPFEMRRTNDVLFRNCTQLNEVWRAWDSFIGVIDSTAWGENASTSEIRTAASWRVGGAEDFYAVLRDSRSEYFPDLEVLAGQIQDQRALFSRLAVAQDDEVGQLIDDLNDSIDDVNQIVFDIDNSATDLCR
jgi:hypothetical protein